MAADFNEDGWLDLCITNHKGKGDHKFCSEIWWNGPNGFNHERTTALPTVGARGPTKCGPGNVADRGPEEIYTSAPERVPEGARVKAISWEGRVPAKTWVKAQLRFADTEAGLAAAPWIGPDGNGSWLENGSRVAADAAAGRWVQYRLTLGAVNGCGTPRITEVRVVYGQ